VDLAKGFVDIYFEDMGFWTSSQGLSIGFMLCLIFPICLLRDLSKVSVTLAVCVSVGQ